MARVRCFLVSRTTDQDGRRLDALGLASLTSLRQLTLDPASRWATFKIPKHLPASSAWAALPGVMFLPKPLLKALLLENAPIAER